LAEIKLFLFIDNKHGAEYIAAAAFLINKHVNNRALDKSLHFNENKS